MKIKKFNENKKGKQIYLNNPVANSVAKLNPGKESEIISDFQKFERMIDTLLSEFKTRKIIGNTLSDLGNFIGQTIYEYIDEDDSAFSSDDFIGGFEHGVDSMKEPSKSRWHNF